MLRITFESAIITSVFFRKRQKSMYLSTQNLEMIERLSAEPVQQKQGLREYVFRHIVPSPQRIIKHIPMCKNRGKRVYYYIYIIVTFYWHFIRIENTLMIRCGVVALWRKDESMCLSCLPFTAPPHQSHTGRRSTSRRRVAGVVFLV